MKYVLLLIELYLYSIKLKLITLKNIFLYLLKLLDQKFLELTHLFNTNNMIKTNCKK